jgi:CheY-like chemotaxis protein
MQNDTITAMSYNNVNLVMLVDDNDTDNFISRRIIELTKFAPKIEVKNSGKSALEYLENAKNNPALLPDLIFLDINMPIVDGFSFLFEFSRFPDNVKEKCKIVVLSSSDNKRDIERIISEKYVITFITKPLTDEALKKVREKLNVLH